MKILIKFRISVKSVHRQGKQLCNLHFASFLVGANPKKKDFAPLGANSFLKEKKPF